MVLKTKKTAQQPLLNENIPFTWILLISENGQEKKEISRHDALNLAKESGLDLWCVDPFANPPVCKLVNYYRLSKQKKVKKQKTNKEINISYNIEESDLEKIKLSKIWDWTDKGLTVKVNFVLARREKSHPEEAIEKCQKIIAKLQVGSPHIKLKGNIERQGGNFYFFLFKKKQ